MFDMTGKVTRKSEKKTLTNDKVVQDFSIVETVGQYPNSATFNVYDKESMIDKVNAGDIVDVSFNLQDKEYNGKHYTSLKARLVKPSGSKKTEHKEEKDD